MVHANGRSSRIVQTQKEPNLVELFTWAVQLLETPWSFQKGEQLDGTVTRCGPSCTAGSPSGNSVQSVLVLV
jgi:hypothetical protein